MKKEHWILIIILVLTFTTRLTLAFYLPNFTYESYFHLKHVEHITNTGLPRYQDPLSYGGRTLLFLPAFHYFLAFFDLTLPLEPTAKIISNLLLTSLIILVYLIAKKITQKETPSLYSAFIAAFLPILWQTNSVSPYHMFLPLTLLAIYALMNLNKKKFIFLYISSILILSLTTPATFLLIIGLLLYLLLSRLEEKRILKAELELTLFSLFLFIWVQFLFFKDVLLSEGPQFIWQNIPAQIISEYFPKISVLQSLVLVGIIPLIAGIYIIYKSLFQEKNKNIFLLFSLAVSIILLFILNLVEFEISLMFLGLIFAILFSQAYLGFLSFFRKTKASKFKIPSLILITVLIVVTSVLPSLSLALDQKTPSNAEIEAFIWLKENTKKDTTALVTLKEGHLLNYAAKRKNMMDDQFFLIPDSETKFNDLSFLFISPYQTQALSLIDKYQIDYLVLTPAGQAEHKIKKFPYVDSRCFERIYNQEVKIYQPKCQIT